MLQKKTGIDKRNLPSSYQIVGDVLLLKLLNIDSEKEKKKIASAIMEMFPRIRTVCEIKGIESEYRVPKVAKLAGNGFVTTHKEHGIRYKLDVSKVMFSKGNLHERQRLLKEINKNEIVADMFAGIGYFSLGIAKRAKKVYAVEKNPAAFRYLKENIKLNKIKNIVAINMDCRNFMPKENIDRIIMGYFPRTEKFLPHALSIIENGIVHYHNSAKNKEEIEKQIKNACGKRKYKIKQIRKVKSIAPRTYHFVADIEMDEK